MAHEVQLALIRAAHEARLSAAAAVVASGPSASLRNSQSGDTLAPVALPAHVKAQLVHAKQGTSAVHSSATAAVVSSLGSAAGAAARSGNFLLAAAAQSRGSEMMRKRSRVAARVGHDRGGADERHAASAAPLSASPSCDGSAATAAVEETTQHPYPVVYRCESQHSAGLCWAAALHTCSVSPFSRCAVQEGFTNAVRRPVRLDDML